MATTVFEQNKKKLPDLEKFKDTKSSFLQNIYNTALRYSLTNRQIEAAQGAWNRISSKNWITFTPDQIEKLEVFFRYLFHSWQMHPHNYEFLQSVRNSLEREKKLTDKQVESLIRRALKIKRAVMKHIFKGY